MFIHASISCIFFHIQLIGWFGYLQCRFRICMQFPNMWNFREINWFLLWFPGSYEIKSRSSGRILQYVGQEGRISCFIHNILAQIFNTLSLTGWNTFTFLGIANPPNGPGGEYFPANIYESNIPYIRTIERIYCFAPIWNSFTWINKSIDVRGTVIAEG